MNVGGKGPTQQSYQDYPGLPNPGIARAPAKKFPGGLNWYFSSIMGVKYENLAVLARLYGQQKFHRPGGPSTNPAYLCLRPWGLGVDL